MSSEGFFMLSITGFKGNKWLRLHCIDDEVIEMFFIIVSTGNKDSLFTEIIEAFELIDKSFCDLVIGDVIGEGEFNGRDTFGRDDDMDTVSTEEEG